MYGLPPRGHLRGQTRDNSNTRFFTLKRNTYTYFVLSYSTHIWNVYVAGNLLEIKKREKRAMHVTTITRLIILKR